MAQNQQLLDFINQEVPIDAPDGSKMVLSENVNNAVTATAMAMGNQTPPVGGTEGQILRKKSATDYDTEWANPTAQVVGVTSFKTRTGDVVPLAGDYDKTMVGLGNVDNTSDVNKPVSTAQAAAIGAKIDSAQKGAAGGVATLDGNSKIPTSQLPAIAIGETFTANSQAQMLALPANIGDVAIRTDQNGAKYMLLGEPASVAGNWADMGATGPVTSVNGQTGPVVLSKGDIGLGQVDNTSDVNKPVSTAQQAAINARIPSTEKGAAGGVATLDGASKLPTAQLPALTKAMVGLDQVDNTSDANKPVSTAQATAINARVPNTEKGAPGGVATLDGTGKLTATQLPALSKSMVGLDQVDNTSDMNKPVSLAQDAADDAVYAAAIQRINHTGTQPQSTIENLTTDLAARAMLTTAKKVASPAYTLGAADDGVFIAFTAAGGCTVTVPNNLRPGFTCELWQESGQVTVIAGAGVSLFSADGMTKTRKLYSVISVRYFTANDVALAGDMA